MKRRREETEEEGEEEERYKGSSAAKRRRTKEASQKKGWLDEEVSKGAIMRSRLSRRSRGILLASLARGQTAQELRPG